LNLKHLLLTDNKKLAEKARKIGGQGYKNLDAKGGVIKFGKEGVVQDPKYKRHDTLGWNYRMTNLQAAIGLAQLKKLNKFILIKRKMGAFYYNSLKDMI